MSSSIFRTGDSPDGPVDTASGRRGFPLGTLMVCFTTWLIATEILVFDQVKFDAKVELLEQAGRALGRPQVMVPTHRPSNLPGNGKVEKL